MVTSFLMAAAAMGLVAHSNAGARLELSDFWMDFGEVQIGDQERETLQLENTGDVAVEITDVDFAGDDGFDVDGGDCERILAPGESCDIDVSFEPEEAGRFSGEVEIETAIGELEFNVSGEGVHK
jgi:hypothetical protein